jgi:hypothetical protein
VTTAGVFQEFFDLLFSLEPVRKPLPCQLLNYASHYSYIKTNVKEGRMCDGLIVVCPNARSCTLSEGPELHVENDLNHNPVYFVFVRNGMFLF